MFAIGLISFFLVKLVDSLNVKRNITPLQISECAKLILDKYSNYKPEDFVRAINGMRSMEFGKFYEGLDIPKIMEMFAMYDKLRDEEIMQQRKDEASQYKEKYVMHESVADVLKNIQMKERENKPKAEIVSTSNDRGNELLREFDKLHREQGIVRGGIRYVQVDGMTLSSEAYMKMKWNDKKANEA